MNPDSKRLIGADGVRAIACLWVLIHHLTIVCEMDYGGWVDILRHEGSLGVSIFFVLSGLLLSRPYWLAALNGTAWPDLRHYAWARMVRILPAYYVCLLVSFVLFYDATADSVWRFISSLLFLNWTHWRTFFPTPVNSPLWSIGIEVAFYALLPLWALGLMRVRRLWTGLAYVAATQCALVVIGKLCFGYVFSLSGSIAVSDPLQLDAYELLPAKNPLGLFSHFLFGCAAAGVLVELSRRATRPPEGSRWIPNRFDALALACLALAAIETYPAMLSVPAATTFINRAEVWYLFYKWPIFPALIATLLVALHRSKLAGLMFDNRFLRWTARLSYGIYLWHEVSLRLLARVWPSPVTTLSASTLLYAAVAIALAYGASSLSFRLIEQPALDWTKSRARRAETPGALASTGAIAS